MELTPFHSSFPVPAERSTGRDFSIEAVIGGWIAAKFEKSRSARTQEIYYDTICAFRLLLQEHGRDLLYPPDAMPQFFRAEISDAAQIYAGSRAPGSRHKGDIAPATVAQRLAILSSFYAYCLQKEHLHHTIGNPIDRAERPHVEAYAQALPLEAPEVRRRLGAIDPGTHAGLRDLALLSVLLSTGRRVSEVAGLRRSSIELTDNKLIRLSFKRTKGGGMRRDTLSAEVSIIFAKWLAALYGPRFLQVAPHMPVWIDVRHESRADEPLGYQGIRGVVQAYLGVSKVHATRHTAAVLMELAGAKLTEIQRMLGHKNAATTGIYLEQLNQDKNLYADKMAELLGLVAPPAKKRKKPIDKTSRE